MNILIVGAGFIGNRLFNFLKNNAQVTIINKQQVNYTEKKLFYDCLDTIKPDIVLNCSGYTGSPNVDGCENNKSDCLFYNVSVPVQLYNACSDKKIKFINLSSGCIYTGYAKMFSEKDEPNFGLYNANSSYYSFSKHMCEKLLDRTNAITLRIRMPFNSDIVSKNLIYKILKYDNIIDLKNSGTCTDDLNVFVEKLIHHKDLLNISGPLNVINPGIITGRMISEYLAFSNIINPNWKIVDINELNIVAQRSNCVLSDRKIKKLGLSLPPVVQSLKLAVRNFSSNYDKFVQQKTS